MVHDPNLLDKLDAFPKEGFSGTVFRATRQSLDPLTSSFSGGHCMTPGTVGVLYISLLREGALAEISFHWSQLDPLPTKAVVVHSLKVVAHHTLKLLRADLTALGISEATFGTSKLSRAQEIGAAVEFLGCDGLIAPSARWPCENLILFPDRMSVNVVLEIHSSEPVDWIQWASDHSILKTGS